MPSFTEDINHISQCWKSLPSDLKRELLVGSVAKSQLILQAQKALSLASSGSHPQYRSLAGLGQDMLLAAWEQDPFDGSLASQLIAIDSIQRYLPGDLLPLLKAISTRWCVPSQAQQYEELSMCGDMDRAAKFLEERVHGEPTSLYWLWQVQKLTVLEGEWEWGERLLGTGSWPAPLDRLHARMRADLAYYSGRYDLWKELTHAKAISFTYADRLLHLGNMAFFENDRRRAAASWMRSLQLRPWQSNLILRLYDTLKGVDRERRHLPGRVSVCLYSYNKAEELSLALNALAQSDLGNAEVFVLVNGSVDHTRNMLDGWQQKIGSTRLHVIDLPVNIGAPAARNWLMHHPDVQSTDWVAYLDDDALVPPDWLSLLGAAASLYPEAGAWGCRVVDHRSHHVLQSVDYHLRPPESLASEATVPFFTSVLHYEVFDKGQFSYLRPCIHATGCCHLFSRQTLRESGDFDLRFSPSQFDDLEHDIRFALARKPVAYHGHLVVQHMNRTGKQSRVSQSQQRSAGANLYKLHHKYTSEEYTRIMEWETTILEEDLQNKLRQLGGEA